MQKEASWINCKESSTGELNAASSGGPDQSLSSSGPVAATCTHRRPPPLVESVRDLQEFLACPEGTAFRAGQIVYKSEPMRSIVQQAQRVASSKASVLVEGESGTGKELLARLIHHAGSRASKPFVRLNCAALSETLIESELFGHERGAFTGATESRVGRFEWANSGTLLLDEVSEMSLRMQAKLLRVMEEEEFERVGSTRTLRVDVRIVATTNRPLDAEVSRGRFRPDLYYRLNVIRLRIPPLRHRPEDISLLANFFLERYRHESTGPVCGISRAAMTLMKAYHWPGNVRQLRNAIHHACLLARGPEICPDDLPALEPLSTGAGAVAGRTLAEIERHVILETLKSCGGNKTAAARCLGITSRTLLNKMKKYRQMGVA